MTRPLRGSVGILGVDMNLTHVRVWTTGGCADFELPRGRLDGAMSEPTLLEDLEAAANRVDCRDGDNCRAYDGKQCDGHHMSKRLRAHATRLREEMAKLEQHPWPNEVRLLHRINGGAK